MTQKLGAAVVVTLVAVAPALAWEPPATLRDTGLYSDWATRTRRAREPAVLSPVPALVGRRREVAVDLDPEGYLHRRVRPELVGVPVRNEAVEGVPHRRPARRDAVPRADRRGLAVRGLRVERRREGGAARPGARDEGQRRGRAGGAASDSFAVRLPGVPRRPPRPRARLQRAPALARPRPARAPRGEAAARRRGPARARRPRPRAGPAAFDPREPAAHRRAGRRRSARRSATCTGTARCATTGAARSRSSASRSTTRPARGIAIPTRSSPRPAARAASSCRGRKGTASACGRATPTRARIAVRIASRRPATQMPPLGTQVVDEEAVRLVRRWIAEDLGERGQSLARNIRRLRKETVR